MIRYPTFNLTIKFDINLYIFYDCLLTLFLLKHILQNLWIYSCFFFCIYTTRKWVQFILFPWNTPQKWEVLSARTYTVTCPNNLGSFESARLLYCKPVLLFWSCPCMDVKYTVLVPLDRLFDWMGTGTNKMAVKKGKWLVKRNRLIACVQWTETCLKRA